MNISSVNLNLLVAFEALVTEQSVGRAAARVGVTQGAMSNALNRLRDLFDDPLFIRTRQGMLPTARATALTEPVRSALALLRTVVGGEQMFEPTRSNRTFTIAMTDYAEMVIFSRLMGELLSIAPGMQVRLRRLERIFSAPEDLLRTGVVDLAIGFFPSANTLDRALASQDLFTEENVCIGRKDNPVMRGKRLTLKAFASASHVGIFTKPERQGLIDNLLQPLGLRRRLAYTTPNMLAVPYVVASSPLIAVVPAGLAASCGRFLRLAVHKLPLQVPPFCMRMLWHERFNNDSAHSWLRELIALSSSQI